MVNFYIHLKYIFRYIYLCSWGSLYFDEEKFNGLGALDALSIESSKYTYAQNYCS